MKRFRTNRVVTPRTPGELDAMEAAGHVVGQALLAVERAIRPGVSTSELDAVAESVIRGQGAAPSFKGYQGFPGSLCTSINEVVVHGIPTADDILQEGDLISVDCGAILDGWHGDSAITVEVGRVDPDVHAVNVATWDILQAGIAAMVPGNRLTDISWAIEQATRRASRRYGYKFAIVREFGGHGIGRVMHCDPFLPNHGLPGRGPRIAEGSVLAIEPMISLGSAWTAEASDKWTTFIDDGAVSAHWEHTIAATANGPRVLTVREL